jgi:hypothetical protein
MNVRDDPHGREDWELFRNPRRMFRDTLIAAIAQHDVQRLTRGASIVPSTSGDAYRRYCSKTSF